MYRIILVDDEPQIRHGLSNLIIWDELGIELVGEASNGEEALALIENEKPHLAIVDIQMPKMDGISLLKETLHLPYAPKLIMLSGFNQFDYVRESLRLGACNYLLKPVNEDELKNTLQETLALIDDEAAKKQQFEESMAALLNNTLNRLISGRIDVRELREKCELLNITFRCNHMSIGLIKPLFNNDDTSQRHIIFDSLRICNMYLKGKADAYCVADVYDNIAIIFKSSDQLLDNNYISALLAECSQLMSHELNINCLIASGTNADSYKGIPESYNNALSQINNGELQPQKKYSHNVQLAIDFLDNNYNDSNISLKTLANNLGINPAYLGRQFNQETGQFFSDYLNSLRINHAKELLSSSSMKVSEIALAVGFSSVSYFNAIYKKITGKRPGNR